MTDNFKTIRALLKFRPKYFYYVQLIRRRADDPMTDGKPDPRYHGNMHSRSIRDYYITSFEAFDRLEPEIKSLCHTQGVRAYIRLNQRSYEDVCLHMMENIVSYCKNKSFPRPDSLLSSACGKVKSENRADTTWLVDLDIEYLPYEDFIKDMIMKCKCTTTQNIITINSKTGKHLIVHPFNLAEFQDLWNCASLAMPAPSIHKDDPTILYAE